MTDNTQTSGTPKGAGPMVMIVEDDADISRAIQMRLEMHGFQTCQAFDATSAMGVAKENSPALALLDVSMPGGSGFDVAADLRAEPETQNVPVIFLTASLRPDFPETAELMGAAAFLQKPFNSAELLETICKLLPEVAKAA